MHREPIRLGLHLVHSLREFDGLLVAFLGGQTIESVSLGYILGELRVVGANSRELLFGNIQRRISLAV